MHCTRRFGIAGERGAALLTTIVILGLLTALAAAYGSNVRAHLGLRAAASQERVAFYAAEGGLNVGVTRFANIFRAAGVPSGPDFHQQVTVGSRTADVTLATVANCNPCTPSVIPPGELFAGLNTIPYRYTVQSLSLNSNSEAEAHVAGQFDINTIPIFQFLAFIDAHLFIMPLPNMTLHGRMHSNHRIYLQPDATLIVADNQPTIPDVQVTAADKIYRGGYKYDSTWKCTGTTTIDALEDKVSPFGGDLDPKTLACGSGTGPVTDATLTAWKGSMKQQVQNIITPDVGIINRGGSSEYWSDADLRIVLRLDQAKAAVNFGAADLCPNGGGTCNNTNGAFCLASAGPTTPNCGGGANVCSRTSPLLYPIEVQDSSGLQNATKTRALLRFMCERRGALTYTDVPTNPPTPPNGNATFVGTRTNYNPSFNNGGAAAPNDHRRVYRRFGEDTGGNGTITAADSNMDICAVGVAGARPWWDPVYCVWSTTASNTPTTVGAQYSSWFNDLDYRRGAFYNQREQQYMYLMNIDIRALIEWNQVNNDVLFPHADTTGGGLVFFLSVIGANSTAASNNYGVRIFDSADLDTRDVTFAPGLMTSGDPTGLTIVSDQGVIIEGNYNYKDKYPAAVLSDAQWILSQGWEVPVRSTSTAGTPCTPANGLPAAAVGGYNCIPNDQKSVYDLSTDIRDVPANDLPGTGLFSNTNSLGINAALLFGLGASTLNPDYYNGGLENFPRFLEDWAPRTMNYRGSFVSLGKAQHKLANWACGSGPDCLAGVYEPPTRLYDYDSDFNNVAKLPPMTPKIVYVQQLLYTRIFN